MTMLRVYVISALPITVKAKQTEKSVNSCLFAMELQDQLSNQITT